MVAKIITLDDLDHQLIHALKMDGRVPFARVAQVLDVSEQTVARRFRRLRSAGVLRVVGVVDPVALGEPSWLVRIRSRPDASTALAMALARRPDVGWVTLLSGGAEVSCLARTRTSRQRDELLLQRLPRTAQVLDVRAHSLLHRFDDPATWTIGGARLTPAQILELRSAAGVPAADRVRAPDLETLSTDDELILDALAEDGRSPVSRLAEVVGWSPPRVQRRLDELTGAGLLTFDTEVAMGALGFRAMAFLWLTVTPAGLHAAGQALSGHEEVRFVAATTGSTNLGAAVGCRDSAHLYRYVSGRLGAIEGITGLEVAPVLRRVKQSGSMMAGEFLLGA